MANSLTSPRLAVLLAVLKAANGKPLTTGEIARRMAARGVLSAAVSTDLSDLRRSPDLAALGYAIPPHQRRVVTDPDGARRVQYLYRLAPAGVERAGP